MSDLDITFKDLMEKFNIEAQKHIDYMEDEMAHIRVGRADPNMVADLLVHYYEEQVRLKEIAQIQVPSPQKLTIKPFEKTSIPSIGRALNESKLNADTIVDADKITLTLHPLTEEARMMVNKKIKALGDDTKLKIRYCRRDILHKWKKLEGRNDDIDQEFEIEIDKSIKNFNKTIDELIIKKEKEIMPAKGNGQR